jgi:hypothetical protein
MTDPNSKYERVMFERWVKDKKLGLWSNPSAEGLFWDAKGGGGYYNRTLNDMWEAWQARAQMEAEWLMTVLT